MVATERQANANVHDGVAGQDTRGQCFGDTGVDRSDVLLGDNTTSNLVEELVAATGARGLQGDDDVTVLTLTTGLTNVLLFDLLDLLANGLTVGHLWLTDVGVH